MFNEIVKILMDKKTMVDEIGVQFAKMLKIGKEMFITATDYIYQGGDEKAVYEKIYPNDKKLNKLECKIRSEVVTHISLSGADNLSSMLIFMSVVKDAERIGDYIKNLFEIAVHAKDFGTSKLGKKTMDLKSEIVKNFDYVKKSFENEEDRLAKKCLKEIAKMQKQCDAMIAETMETKNKDKNVVAYALTVRYYKRILAHLSNITTSVIMPVNKLDYFDEDNQDELLK